MGHPPEYNADNQRLYSSRAPSRARTRWGSASLFYDQNGNLTSDGINSYNWNARNQLGSMNFGNVSFQYDGYGRRMGKMAWPQQSLDSGADRVRNGQ